MPEGRPSEAMAFNELRRYHTRTLWFNWAILDNMIFWLITGAIFYVLRFSLLFLETAQKPVKSSKSANKWQNCNSYFFETHTRKNVRDFLGGGRWTFPGTLPTTARMPGFFLLKKNVKNQQQKQRKKEHIDKGKIVQEKIRKWKVTKMTNYKERTLKKTFKRSAKNLPFKPTIYFLGQKLHSLGLPNFNQIWKRQNNCWDVGNQSCIKLFFIWDIKQKV